MRKIFIYLLFFVGITQSFAQNVQIDGRLQPYLQQFFEYCKSYDIDYHDKLFKLKKIDIVDSLSVSARAMTLGMVTRDADEKIENIIISYVALMDQEILKIVAFHEFSHYFLDYKGHVCDDCGKIMAVVNSSYFDIANDWDNQVEILFKESPAYKMKKDYAYTGVNVDSDRHM